MGDGIHLPAMSQAVSRLQEETFIWIAGEMFVPTCEGALWWPAQKTLIVSDLHLEKGSSYAQGGQLLPPYDTASTLQMVEALAARFVPVRIISLGDSFHDRASEERLSNKDCVRIRALTAKYDWHWVEGNHDPDPPAHLGGRGTHALSIGSCVFRHEPTGAVGEIAGHLHPVVKIGGRGRSVRRKCFVTDGDSLVMPSLGTLTGGLNALDPVVAACFSSRPMHFASSGPGVRFVDRATLLPDRRGYAGGSGWRL
ncbi:ligase-associated DNA damage response endonuclease PdeM [Henriciella pelagia]|jgi:uncharacterized protein|uniref:Metallophosphatase n=2 Tax=Henriciella pelagia TaxID=1977912 RepID=A0ABQ1J490_9PROT|nr:ligase-associated DNA damage response endonuclease PdeM [Henriciella pelagia]GGB59527.1 metallophosphatase [Henriciella pelagia]